MAEHSSAVQRICSAGLKDYRTVLVSGHDTTPPDHHSPHQQPGAAVGRHQEGCLCHEDPWAQWTHRCKLGGFHLISSIADLQISSPTSPTRNLDRFYICLVLQYDRMQPKPLPQTHSEIRDLNIMFT